MDGDLAETLQRLVDAGDIDGLLEVVTPDEIAMAWHRYGATPEPKSTEHPDWWAIELFMTSEIFQRRELHRDLILKLIEHSDEDRLGNVGAGPLEDFISDNEADLAWLEAQCETNVGLRTALSGVWCATFVTPATLARLDAAARGALARPRPRSELPAEMNEIDDARERFAEIAPGRSAYLDLDSLTPEQRAAAEELRSTESRLIARLARRDLNTD
jgi:hypothetical protein